MRHEIRLLAIKIILWNAKVDTFSQAKAFFWTFKSTPFYFHSQALPETPFHAPSTIIWRHGFVNYIPWSSNPITKTISPPRVC